MKTRPHTPESHSTKEIGMKDPQPLSLVARKAYRERAFGLVAGFRESRGPQSTCPIVHSRQHPRLVRWTSNDFGTVLSRIDILARYQGNAIRRYLITPGVRVRCACPAACRTGSTDRWCRGACIDPADAAPEYWHHVHNRLSVNETPRLYTAPAFFGSIAEGHASERSVDNFYDVCSDSFFLSTVGGATLITFGTHQTAFQ